MNQAPFLIKGWLQCLHSSLRSMGRSRVESDIALLLAGREHECVSQPSVPGIVLPMMPTTLLLNAASMMVAWTGCVSPLEDSHKRRLKLGIKTAPNCFARSLKALQRPPDGKAALSL